MRWTVSVAVHWRGKKIRFHYMHFFTSSQKVCTRLQKNNAHRKKSQKSKENIVKLRYSAQELLLRTSSPVLVYVLIC